jgi:hypothetical protein
MMKRLLTLVFVVLTTGSFAQHFMDQTRDEIETRLREKFPKANFLTTDSTLVMHENQQSIEFVYHFTPEGKCRAELASFADHAAFRSHFDHILSMKKYKWKKINGNQYISKFRKRLLLETDPDLAPRYWILKAGWNRRTYRMLHER